MDQLTSILKNIVNSHATYNCYAIKHDKESFVGTKIGLTNEQLEIFMAKAIHYLCDNVYNSMALGDYPSASPKEYIERISCDDDRINSSIIALTDIIKNPETNITNPNKYNAYMISVNNNDLRYLFITKKKPFRTYGKRNFIYTSLSNMEYKELPDDYIKLVMHFDCFIVGGHCYIVTIDGRKFFYLEDIALKESLKTKDSIIENHIIRDSDIAILDKYLSTPKNYGVLANPDYEIINELSNINTRNKNTLIKKYKLPIIKDNGSLYIDISSPEKLKDFLDTINHKRALNFDNEIVYCKSPFTVNP